MHWRAQLNCCYIRSSSIRFKSPGTWAESRCASTAAILFQWCRSHLRSTFSSLGAGFKVNLATCIDPDYTWVVLSCIIGRALGTSLCNECKFGCENLQTAGFQFKFHQLMLWWWNWVRGKMATTVLMQHCSSICLALLTVALICWYTFRFISISIRGSCTARPPRRVHSVSRVQTIVTWFDITLLLVQNDHSYQGRVLYLSYNLNNRFGILKIALKWLCVEMAWC